MPDFGPRSSHVRLRFTERGLSVICASDEGPLYKPPLVGKARTQMGHLPSRSGGDSCRLALALHLPEPEFSWLEVSPRVLPVSFFHGLCRVLRAQGNRS